MVFSQSEAQPAAGPLGEGQIKTEYFSDNSASLPGISGSSGPVGFEPGMFRKDGTDPHHKTELSSKVIFLIIIFISIYLLLVTFGKLKVLIDEQATE